MKKYPKRKNFLGEKWSSKEFSDEECSDEESSSEEFSGNLQIEVRGF
jgi:hypothetical protein